MEYIQTLIRDTIRNFESKSNLRDINNYTRYILNQTDSHSNLLINIIPIYYLFDNKINPNIGCQIPQRDIVMSFTDAHTLFNIIPDKITNLSCGNHATILYTFENREKNYLYYSNSGLGIQNQALYRSKIYLIDRRYKT